MCGDCRVIDIYSDPNEVRITDAMSERALPSRPRARRQRELARAEVYGLLARALLRAARRRAARRTSQVAVTEAPAAGRLPRGALARAGRRARARLDAGGGRATSTTRCSAASASPRSSSSARTTSPASSTRSRWSRCATTCAALGLARDEAMTETEDHIACLCEVMRYLIAGDDVGVSNLDAAAGASSTPTCSPGSTGLCDAIAAHPRRRLLSRRWPASRAPSSQVEAQASTCSMPEPALRGRSHCDVHIRIDACRADCVDSQ